MKKLLALVFALICVFALVGCSASRADAIQLCINGLAKLNSQTELHYLAYTLEGSSNNTYMVRKGETECWVSGENWLSYTVLDNQYTLSVENKKYHTVANEADHYVWEPKIDTTDAPPFIPELDLDIYHVESDNTENGVRTIMLNYDEPQKSGNQSSAVYQLEFQFADAIMTEFKFSKLITFPGTDGGERCISYTDVLEFYGFEDGAVSEKIQSNYEAALSEN